MARAGPQENAETKAELETRLKRRDTQDTRGAAPGAVPVPARSGTRISAERTRQTGLSDPSLQSLLWRTDAVQQERVRDLQQPWVRDAHPICGGKNAARIIGSNQECGEQTRTLSAGRLGQRSRSAWISSGPDQPGVARLRTPNELKGRYPHLL
uniref:Uncharacterized protein n=1 Tax=Knipowitschia caucasica TaxID=637954 RepID=A0AAV2LHC3_KNICA